VGCAQSPRPVHHAVQGFAPSASPPGRRTHVSLCSVTTFLPPPP